LDVAAVVVEAASAADLPAAFSFGLFLLALLPAEVDAAADGAGRLAAEALAEPPVAWAAFGCALLVAVAVAAAVAVAPFLAEDNAAAAFGFDLDGLLVVFATTTDAADAPAAAAAALPVPPDLDAFFAGAVAAAVAADGLADDDLDFDLDVDAAAAAADFFFDAGAVEVTTVEATFELVAAAAACVAAGGDEVVNAGWSISNGVGRFLLRCSVYPSCTAVRLTKSCRRTLFKRPPNTHSTSYMGTTAALLLVLPLLQLLSLLPPSSRGDADDGVGMVANDLTRPR
jgi:hypothetical protein